jgi:hypothetical protein
LQRAVAGPEQHADVEVVGRDDVRLAVTADITDRD